MDYSVGSVAALISGNVTPNRPKLTKRALTPMKHQTSPNVTPKSEFLDDRSIFLSPSVQKKKAIVKKSPKRIFENPDLDVTEDSEGSQAIVSPKAEKVKKHLKEDLEADEKVNISPKSPKSPKKAKAKLDKTTESEIFDKNLTNNDDNEKNDTAIQSVNESTPKKKKKQRNSLSVPVEDEKENLTEQNIKINNPEKNSASKKKRKLQIPTEDASQSTESINQVDKDVTPKKKQKKNKSKSQESVIQENPSENIEVKLQNQTETKKRKKKNKKNKKKLQNIAKTTVNENPVSESTHKTNQSTNKTTVNENPVAESTNKPSPKKKKKGKNIVNPNAITDKDSDSEHESDNEIQSENDETNNQILNTRPAESSDDEEEEKEVKKVQKQEKKGNKQENSEEEVKRTLFVGNVPFSKKCKKEIKKLFSKYGQIETVRIRTIPVKDARVTPKLAAIKNELHPERTTVNVYVKFQLASSVDKALAENNTVLNDHHLRVTRSDTTGVEHDPNKAIFVGNLPFALEDDALRAKFEKCGDIESVRIVRDNKTNAGKGFGYVNFASKDGVELALAMSEEDLTIKNRILRVKRCNITNKKFGAKQGNPQNVPRNAQKFQGNSQKFQGNAQKFQGRDRNIRNNDDVGRNQGKFGRSQGNRMRSQGNFENVDKRQGQDGAHRRILKKRQSEETGEGPPNKRANINQPAKEKKPRKEFVGMTAEKKKKQKINKGQKKKRALSEILTKYNDK